MATLETTLNSACKRIPETQELSNFKGLYLTYANVMLKLARERLSQTNPREHLVQEFQFAGREYTTFARHIPTRDRIIPSPDDDAFPQAIANACADAFFSSGLARRIKLSDDAGTPIENPSLDTLRPIINHMQLDWPIRHLVQRYNRMSFSRRQILACLDRYIAHWKGEAATDPRLAPLYNFETEIETIRLSEFVSIVRFTDEEKTRTMNSLAPLEEAIDLRNYASSFHVVRLRSIDGSCDEGTRNAILGQARKTLQCTITTLRLLKPEPIGTMGYIHTRKLAGPTGPGFSPLEEYNLPWNWLSRFRDPYVLERADLSRFRRLYKILSRNEFQKWNELGIPLRRFNHSCQRERDEDRILDYVICVESALLYGDRSELSYRLALRAAKLLRDRYDPKQTFDHMRCLYDVRSRIVHENSSLHSPSARKDITRAGLTPQSFARSTDTLMRELMSTIIERIPQDRGLEQLCSDLDNEVVKSL